MPSGDKNRKSAVPYLCDIGVLMKDLGKACREPTRSRTCPCPPCFEWRRHTFTPAVFSQLQENIRAEALENVRVSRRIDAVIRASA